MRLINGDCIEVMAGMPDSSADFIFTDPPYGHNNNSDDPIGRREAALGEIPRGAALPAPRPIAPCRDQLHLSVD